MNTALEDQFACMELKWESSRDEIEDETVYGDLQRFVNSSEDYVDMMLKASEDFITEKSIQGSGTGATSSTGNAKIDDTLRPKDTLLRSFNLEEANLWFQRFTAYFNHNEKALRNQDATVQRQLLDNCIEASLASALQTDEKVKDDTPVIGHDSRLARLKEIFLELNPLFLRRYHFQECKQEQGESVTEWWVRKKAAARECELEKITKDDVMLLELIRGVRDPKLKEEFLKQREPDLTQLVQIAERWQTASHVAKKMGLNTVNVQKASNYKAGKNEQWQRDVQNQTQSPSGKGYETCGWCGGKKHERDKCPARDKDCNVCKKTGHFGKVCRSGGSNQARSKSRGRENNQLKAQSVRVKMARVKRARVKDVSEPTPLMSQVRIIPQTRTPFRFDVLPDTGCYQSLISMDLVKT